MLDLAIIHETIEPYADHEELLEDRLRAARLRLEAALAPTSRADWPAELLALESLIEDRVRMTRANGVELPIMRIRECFQLTASEECIISLLVGHELCPEIRSLLRRLGTEFAHDPTSDALRRAVYGRRHDRRAWRELVPGGRLHRLGLIEVSHGDDRTPDYRQTWRAAPRVVALAYGDLSLDPALSSLVKRTRAPAPAAGLVFNCDTSLVEHAFESSGIVVVAGRAGSGRASLLKAIAAKRGRRVIEFEARAIARDRDSAHRQFRDIARECVLLDAIPLFRDLEALAPTPESSDLLELLEQSFDTLVLATNNRTVARRWSKDIVQFTLPPLDSAQTSDLWRRAVPPASDEDCEHLASLYPLAPALIETVGRLAEQAAAGQPLEGTHIESALRYVLDSRLAGLATRIEVTQSWNDIVLPSDQMTAIIELLARVDHRARVHEQWGFARKVSKGLGVTALFSGPPGTGKSMCAGLVAKSLRCDLYQVDLSKIASKWIGETEKNLAALFDAAEAGHAILLFDEADALFGKRTEVRSSNDRHANQEVNFLLQRLETFSGICVLTTNHESSIDEAFQRRLSVHVRFPTPSAEERARLWRALLPAEAPVADPIDFDDLSERFAMSGGHIRNAVMRAAFLAAEDGGVITTGHLAHAARLEYESLGKIVVSTPKN